MICGMFIRVGRVRDKVLLKLLFNWNAIVAKDVLLLIYRYNS